MLQCSYYDPLVSELSMLQDILNNVVAILVLEREGRDGVKRRGKVREREREKERKRERVFTCENGV